VNLVVDTHALVWYLSREHRRLSRRALLALRHAEAGDYTVHVPAVVLFELVLLEQAGRLRMDYSELRRQIALRPGFPVEPILAEDVDEARSLRALEDPFDRLIAGAARRLGLRLITADSRISESGLVAIYW
jgi:PIN domain nuclease of toxin-antitoxin system